MKRCQPHIVLATMLALCPASVLLGQSAIPERRIERFYVGASGGIVFPITGDYSTLAIGRHFIVEGGWRWKINSKGGFMWGLGYSRSNSTIRRYGPYTTYYWSTEEIEQDISIERYDITLFNPFLLFGKNREGYFHVAINLVINQPTYAYDVIDGTSSSATVRTVSEKGLSQTGLSTEYGLHFPVSNRFGITVDGALVLLNLGKKETSYITYSTTSTTAQGIYGYANLGLMFGIW